MRLGEVLIKQSALTEDQLEKALKEHRSTAMSLGEFLVSRNIIEPDRLARALSTQLNIPFFDLGDEHHLTREEGEVIPEAIARRFCVIPSISSDGSVLTAIMKDPLDLEAIDTLRSLTALDVHKAISTDDRILEVIDREYRDDAHIERNIQDLVELEQDGHELELVEESLGDDESQLRVLANDAPVVKFVNLLLMQAVRDGASDIHFEPQENDVMVRLRVDGQLREVTPPPKNLYSAVVTRIKILSEMNIAERRLPLDGRFKFKVYGRMIDIRVSSLPEVYGEKMVLRLLDRSSLRVDMTEIGFEGDTLREFRRILKEPNGIILLTGPTGSGKTTTLYSALSFLKNVKDNIQTVEDPVEYQLDGINQMQVKEHIGLTFADSLRAILRQDPDIIMIGEVRDKDTAEIAMRASLTGHLVLSTLHTNDAPSSISRIKDIGIPPYLIAATIRLVIAQRLIRLICEDCKEEYRPEPDVLNILAHIRPEAADWTYYRGKGCAKCRNSGYRGRKAVFEFMELTKPLKELVIDDVGESRFRDAAIENGMESLTLNSMKRLEQGISTIEEVMSVWPAGEYGH